MYIIVSERPCLKAENKNSIPSVRQHAQLALKNVI